MYKTIGSKHLSIKKKKQFVINYKRKTKHFKNYHTISFYCFFFIKRCKNKVIGFQIVMYTFQKQNVNFLMAPTVSTFWIVQILIFIHHP